MHNTALFVFKKLWMAVDMTKASYVPVRQLNSSKEPVSYSECLK